MVKYVKTLVCLCVVLLLCGKGAWAQSYNVPSSGTQTISACSGIIYDPGGTGDYSNSCSGTLVVNAATPNCVVHIEGNYNTENNYDKIYIYEGVGTSGTLYGTYMGSGSINITSQTGSLTIRFTSDVSVVRSGFEFSVSCTGSCECGPPTNLVMQPTGNSIHVSWNASLDPTVTRYYLEYGLVGFVPGSGTGVWVNGTSYDIPNPLDGFEYEAHIYFDCGNDTAITTETFSSSTLLYSSIIDAIIPSSGTQTISLCTGTIYDPGGTNNYPNNSSGMLVVESSTANCVLHVQGHYIMDAGGYDKLYIYEGVGTNGTLYGPYTGEGDLNITSQTGTLTFHFTSNGSTNKAGFALNVSCTGSCECGPPANLAAQYLGNSIHVSWDAGIDPTVTQYYLEYGSSGFLPGNGTGVWVSGTSYDIHNVIYGQDYDFRIYFDCGGDSAITTESFSYTSLCVPDTVSCIDMSTLNSPNIICQYGSFSNPYQNTGVVDNGWQSSSSRHTVNLIEATDSRTDNLLNVLPPCERYSVRLGNWSTGSQGESITYTFYVDTADAAILLLKYAAVLQDPNHTSTQQPRFKFELLDQNGNLIDPTCGAADYIANQSLGWNLAGSNILWKDWTTVGTDLSSYHGQNIRVRLTTYDCSQSGHYGYAYFHLNCKKKNISVESCGQTNYNTYSAPAGFHYNWYYENNPTNIISTGQSVTVPASSNRLYCRVISLNNPDCYFTLWTSLTSRYPMADFSQTNVPCSYAYEFDNQSFVSSDELVAVPTGESCQSAMWLFGDGTTSDELEPTHAFPGPGTYPVTLVAGINHGLCADTLTSYVTVAEYRLDTTIVDTTVCESYVWIDSTYTHSGTYTRRFQAASGCDSIVTLRLNALPPVATSFNAVTCDTFQWNGQTYAQTGSFVQHLQTRNGCDSAVTLHLTVLPPSTSEFTASACDTFRWNGQTYTRSGDYTQHFQNVQGCDSAVTLHLTIYSSQVYEFSDANCVSYTWNGHTYTHSGNYVQHFQTSHGCDSMVTLHLTIYPNETSGFTAAYCENYTWDGQTYTQSGNYVRHYQSVHGCDSTATMHLIIYPSRTSEFTASSCMSYYWHGQTYTQSGDYVQHFLTHYGCDSAVTLHLTIYQPEITQFSDASCVSYTWNGQTYTQSGDYVQHFQNVHGCDSTVTLHLTIYPNEVSEFTAANCENYTWSGQTYTQSGDYVQHFQSSHGCDSTVTMHLTIYPLGISEFADTSCMQYVWNGQTYTQSGDYVQHFQTNHGCDSSVTLHLTILQTVTEQIAAAACDSYTWNEQTYTQSGDYVQQFVSTNGCDSIVTLHLTVSPTWVVDVEDVACEGKTYQRYGFTVPAEQTIERDSLFMEQLLQSSAGCDSTVRLHLTIVDTFLAVTASASNFCDGPVVEIQAQSAMDHYSWSTGESTSSIVVINPGYYRVTVSEADCSVSRGVTVEPCLTEITLPNAITPSNQDNLNDYFSLDDIYQSQMSDFAIRIYDRWGNVVFSSRDKGFRWGGDVNGTLITNAMYSYIIQYTDFYGEQFVIKGTLLVL